MGESSSSPMNSPPAVWAWAGYERPPESTEASLGVRSFALIQMTEAGLLNSTSIRTEPSKVSRLGSMASSMMCLVGTTSPGRRNAGGEGSAGRTLANSDHPTTTPERDMVIILAVLQSWQNRDLARMSDGS